jgi:hypothetical protein
MGHGSIARIMSPASLPRGPTPCIERHMEQRNYSTQTSLSCYLDQQGQHPEG